MTTLEALRILDLHAPISPEALSHAHQEALILWCEGRFEGDDELLARAAENTAQIYAAHAWLRSIPESEFPYQGTAERGEGAAAGDESPARPMVPPRAGPPPPLAQWSEPTDSLMQGAPLVKKKSASLAVTAWVVVGAGGVLLLVLLSAMLTARKPAEPVVADSSAPAVKPAVAPAHASSAAASTLTEKSPLDVVRAQAEAGNAVAQRLLGMRLFAGDGVRKNSTEGVKWCRLASEQGDGAAQHELARAYHEGDGVERDDVAALVWTRKAAAQGDKNAQFDLGEVYLQGVGVPKDFAEGVKWMRLSADQGLAEAEYEMGLCYSMGEGVTKDAAEAARWHRKAAEKGIATAQLCLARQLVAGEGLTKDVDEAVKWYRKALAQNNAQAQYDMGVLCAEGTGVPKDLREAISWYKKAAQQGHAEAQQALGFAYALGEGVEESEAESFLWHRKAAGQGLVESQYEVGMAYLDGVGVGQHAGRAVEWLRKAAEQGHAEAQFHLGFSYAQGDGIAKDPAEAVKWYRKSAEQGVADAQYFLGRAYAQGAGIEKSMPRAREWLMKAAEQEEPQAQNDLGDFHILEQEPMQAARWYRRAAENGSSAGAYNLGLSLAKGEGIAEDRVEACAWWSYASLLGHEEAQKAFKELYPMLTPAQISETEARTRRMEQQHPKMAKALAAARAEAARPRPAPEPEAAPAAAAAALPPSAPKPPEALEHLPADVRLNSGTMMMDSLEKLRGEGELTMDNGLAEDAIIKVISANRAVAIFYLRGGEQFNFDHIPDGTYTVMYCIGFGWDGTLNKFTRGRRAVRYEQTFSFKRTLENQNGTVRVFHDSVTLALHHLKNGNTPAAQIPLPEFDRY